MITETTWWFYAVIGGWLALTELVKIRKAIERMVKP